jgi:putative transcriptional regulator
METVLKVPTLFRLKEVLKERGMSQRELALQSKVSPTTVNRMCKNLTAQVSLATLDALCAALGVEPGDLLERKKKGEKRRPA